MNRQSLISLSTAAIAIVMASGANAQETPAKQNSVGPAIEFSGGGTSFGIKGKIGVSPQISVRPMILFGYTPTVSGSTFTQAVANGLTNLTTLVTPTRDQQIAAITGLDATSEAKAAANALLDKKDPTDEEKKIVATAQTPVYRYTTLTREQRLAVVKGFYEVKLTDAQADAIAKQLVDISKIAPADRTPEQKYFINYYGRNAENLTTFADSTFSEQRDTVKKYLANPVLERTVVDALNELDAGATAQKQVAEAQKADPNYKPNASQQAAIATANNLISTASNTLTPGFTPGSGTAYGLAVTYDFQSADSKLSGYVGPRVLLANGSSKIGNFDTSTSETSIGLLVGADYAISSDFTAGLSATYNFSKSGNLDVSGPGSFKGSAPVSGSSLDVGVNLGYRF